MVIYFNVVSSIVHDSFLKLKSVSYEIPTKENGLFYRSYVSDMSKYMFWGHAGNTLRAHKEVKMQLL